MGWVEIGTALGMVTIITGVAWKLTYEVRDHCDGAIKRMYERFDEYKEHLESTHTRREVCEVLHKQLTLDVAEMKADIKSLLKLANGKRKE
jgi:chromosome condensin MukBEF ATPase and DNA-binding subunit MukB